MRTFKLVDIAKSVEPRSDQQNYDDYIGGSKIVTVSDVKKGTSEQPVEVHLVEYPGRPYKPSKSMRRVLFAAWGGEAASWVGRQLELFGDPDVTFGKEKVGGIKIARLSHLAEPMKIQLTVSRGRREPFTVLPLTSAAPDGWREDVAACESEADLMEFFEMARDGGWWSPEVAAACTARKAEIAGDGVS